MSFEAQSKPRRSLRDVFGKGASEETKAITRRAAQLSMNDMAVKLSDKLGDKKQEPIEEAIKAKPDRVGRRIHGNAARVAREKIQTLGVDNIQIQVIDSLTQAARDRLQTPGVVNAKAVVIKVAEPGYRGHLFQDNVLMAVSRDSVLDSAVRTAGYQVRHNLNRTPSNSRDALHKQVEAAIMQAELRGLDISDVTVTVSAKKHGSGRNVDITIGPNSDEDIAPCRVGDPMAIRPYTPIESRPKAGFAGRKRKRAF